MTQGERAASIRDAYKDGHTLAEIGAQWNISRERVRQILHVWGVYACDGGAAVRRERRRIELELAVVPRYGHSIRAHRDILQHHPRAFRKFTEQRNSAKKRGISWELSFAQWWSIWEESGHWSQRGCHDGQFVMSRRGDVGPYSMTNVYINTVNENNREPRLRQYQRVEMSL